MAAIASLLAPNRTGLREARTQGNLARAHFRHTVAEVLVAPDLALDKLSIWGSRGFVALRPLADAARVSHVRPTRAAPGRAKRARGA